MRVQFVFGSLTTRLEGGIVYYTVGSLARKEGAPTEAYRGEAPHVDSLLAAGLE